MNTKLNKKGSTQVFVIALLVLGLVAGAIYYTVQNKAADNVEVDNTENLMETTVQLEEPEGTPEEISNEELNVTDQMLEELELDTPTSQDIDNL